MPQDRADPTMGADDRVLLSNGTADEADNVFPGASVLVSNDALGPGHYRRGVATLVSGEEVQVEFDGSEESCSRASVWPANDGRFVDDVSNLVHISSATLLDNMRMGLEEGSIYSWVGSVLIALNPMRPLPEAYSEAMMTKCYEARGGARVAHPFSQAETAVRELVRRARPASALMVFFLLNSYKNYFQYLIGYNLL